LPFFDFMLVLLAIFFPLITHLFLLNDSLKNGDKVFLDFYVFYRFSTQVPNITSRMSIWCSTKVLSQEDSKFVDIVL
jgi:hypothetical protein